MAQDVHSQITSKAHELAELYRNHPAGIMNCLDALGCDENMVDEAIGAISMDDKGAAVQAISAALHTLQ